MRRRAVPELWSYVAIGILVATAPIAVPESGQSTGPFEAKLGIHLDRPEYAEGNVVNFLVFFQNLKDESLGLPSLSWIGGLFELDGVNLGGLEIDVMNGNAGPNVLDQASSFAYSVDFEQGMVVPGNAMCKVLGGQFQAPALKSSTSLEFGAYVLAMEMRLQPTAPDYGAFVVRGYQEIEISVHPENVTAVSPPESDPRCDSASQNLEITPYVNTNPAVGYEFQARWPAEKFPIAWCYNSSGRPSGISGEFTLLQEAADAWAQVGGGNATHSGGTACSADPSVSGDGINAIGWDVLGPSALAVVTCGHQDLLLNECDMRIDKQDPWSTNELPDPSSYDFLSMATHEMGHFLPQLSDVQDAGDSEMTMYGPATLGETKKRTLEWGDMAGLRYSYPFRIVVDGPANNVGNSSAGMGTAAALIDSDNIYDLIHAWVDNPPGSNTIYYKIGWDARASDGLIGSTSSKTTAVAAPLVGDETSGLGAAFGNIDANPAPDLLLVWANAASGADTLYYRIGWNMNTGGTIGSWTNTKTVGGGNIGSSTAGVGACISVLPGDASPDIVVAWADNATGENQLRYRVGRDADLNGDAMWTSTKTVALGEFVGHETDGVGLACTNLDGDQSVDLVVSWLDDPAGDNILRYRVGLDLEEDGTVSSWSDERQGPGTEHEWNGDSGQGLGLAAADIDAVTVNGNLPAELFFNWIVDRAGANSINYFTEWNGRYLQHP